MALTDEAKKQYQREYMKRKRSNKDDVRPTENVRPKVLDLDVTPVAISQTDKAWEHVKEYIQEETPSMSRLERLQRIAGSLGKLAPHVWFGIGDTGTGLTMADIGSVIGTKEALYKV